MENRVIYKENNYLGGTLGLIGFNVLFYSLIGSYLNQLVILLLLMSFSSLIFLLIINRKMFKGVTIQEDRIVFDYPLNLFGSKKEVILIERIIKVKFFNANYRSSSNGVIKITVDSQKTISFLCSLYDKPKLFTFFKSKGILQIS